MATPIDIYDNVPIYLEFTTAKAQLASNDPSLLKCISDASALGWREAIARNYHSHPDIVQYTTSSTRLRFLDYIPLGPGATVLEIGIGLGQHTFQIAQQVAHLDIFELQLANILFARERCNAQGAQNIGWYCGGDNCLLPFASDRYDVVILNLVLEWCAGSNIQPPIKGQSLLLDEIRRVIKPGGYLQINTKNRFSMHYILGGRDEHSAHVAFGSAMPRWALDFILRHKKLTANGYLHSYRGLSQLLKQAGFDVVKRYELYPEMRYPTVFLEIGSTARVGSGTMLGPMRRAHYAMRLLPHRLRKYFTAGLFTIARKSQP